MGCVVRGDEAVAGRVVKSFHVVVLVPEKAL